MFSETIGDESRLEMGIKYCLYLFRASG